MKLIKEYNEDSLLCEAVVTEEGEKKHFIEGIFLQGNIKNRNGRVYPMETLTNEVKRYTEKYINSNRAFGELGHPDSPTVNLDRVSHMITSLTPEGDNFVGKAKVMGTPMGEIVKNLINEGAKLGVSSRGMGSLDQKNGANYVRDDFYLATAADIVADPSAPNAFVEGVMEGNDWVWNNGNLVEAELVRMKSRIERRTRSRHA